MENTRLNAEAARAAAARVLKTEAEAVLRMVTEADVCILISDTGETAELGDLINHTRRFSIPPIGISRKMDSTLMRAADPLPSCTTAA